MGNDSSKFCTVSLKKFPDDEHIQILNIVMTFKFHYSRTKNFNPLKLYFTVYNSSSGSLTKTITVIGKLATC